MGVAGDILNFESLRITFLFPAEVSVLIGNYHSCNNFSSLEINIIRRIDLVSEIISRVCRYELAVYNCSADLFQSASKVLHLHIPDLKLRGYPGIVNAESSIPVSIAFKQESRVYPAEVLVATPYFHLAVIRMIDLLPRPKGEADLRLSWAALLHDAGKALTRSEDAFGRPVTGYDGIPLVDLGQYYDGSNSVDCVAVDGEAGTTDLYAAAFALDGFHGVSPAGGKIIKSYLPDLSQPGAVKKIEVEMVAAVVLKNSRKAGVFRKIKVQ